MIEVERIAYSDLNAGFFSPDEPLILTGACDGWKAMSTWSLDYFRQRFGSLLVPLSKYTVDPHLPTYKKPRVKLGDYINVITGEAKHEIINHDSYVAGWHFLRNAPELLNDIEIPKCFDRSILDRVNNDVINFDYISLFIGHERVETPLHTDSMGVSVWLANIFGEKVIRFAAPSNNKLVCNGFDIFNAENVQKVESLGSPIYEAHLKPGQLIIIPPGYWHQVKNLAFTIAVSTNYVTPYHFLVFEQQLRSKIYAPYFRLMKYKRELLARGECRSHSLKSLKNFRYIENEEKFLNFVEEQIRLDRRLIQDLKQKVNGSA